MTPAQGPHEGGEGGEDEDSLGDAGGVGGGGDHLGEQPRMHLEAIDVLGIHALQHPSLVKLGEEPVAWRGLDLALIVSLKVERGERDRDW